jgi:exonuclease-1
MTIITLAVFFTSSVHGCAAELGMGLESDKYVTYVLNRIEGLVRFGVKVMMVFDGGPLPSKEGTEVERASSREQARETAKKMMREGNKEGARQAFAKAVDVSPAMAATVITAIKARYGTSRSEVDWLVAPYEADAQLAYLANEGLVDVIFSEDSDNIAYGVARTVFKWDGTCGEQIIFSHVLNMKGNACAGGAGVGSVASGSGGGGSRGGKGGAGLDMSGFDKDMVLYMCVLSGCDYLPCVPGVGVKGAHKLVARHKGQLATR